MRAHKQRRFPLRLAVLLGIVLVIGIVFALVDLSPDLEHLDSAVLSGPEQGNYAAIAGQLAEAAAEQGGALRNRTSGGTVANLQALAAAADSCEIEFALVQDGVPPPAGSELELIGRLPRSESLFVIGKDADRLTRFDDMRGMRIGLGPAGSGTDHLARQIFDSADFRVLGLTLSNHPLDEQLALLERGQLDLAVLVLDEDAALIRDAVRRRGMQIASFQHWDVIARQYSFAWHGRIGAGQFDPIAVLPPADKRVLRVDTLIVGNDCADRTETVALLTLLASEFPTFIEHNRTHGRSDRFPTSSTARRFFDNGGPSLADTHVPWLVDIMEPANWFYVITAISILFNLMTFWHRFRLWRIDANRDKADEVVRDLLGSKLTAEEIHELDPGPEHCTDEAVATLDLALSRLDALRVKCQIQANSMLVPMGQEGTYRFQEDQMESMLTALRLLRVRIVARRAEAGVPDVSPSAVDSDHDGEGPDEQAPENET